MFHVEHFLKFRKNILQCKILRYLCRDFLTFALSFVAVPMFLGGFFYSKIIKMEFLETVKQLQKEGVTIKHEVVFSWSDIALLFVFLFILAGTFAVASKIFK